MFKKICLTLLAIGILFSCKNAKKDDATAPIVEALKVLTHSVEKKWESDTLFKTPESVIFDAQNQVLYVSNIDGTEPWAADGKGSIGKLGLDGKIIQAEWIKGLQAPKGMGIFNNKLYVADLNHVVVIDIANNKIEKKINVSAAKGLNDISIDASGVVYATDSQGKRLFKIETDNPSILIDTLSGPNGVLVRGRDLFVLNSGGFYKVDPMSKSLSKIADGMEGGTDGVENVRGEDYVISCWAGALWYINSDGRKELLYDGKAEGKNTADIGWDGTTNTVYVPTFWKNSVIAFQVKEELK